MILPDNLAHLIQTDCPLAERNWLGLGGPAQYFAEPLSADEVQRLVTWAADQDLRVRVLGGGSNLLVRSSGVDGLVLSLQSAETSAFHVEGNLLTVGTGAKLSQAVVKAVDSGLGGLEHLIGIPGTVGGAVVGNASAGGRDVGSAIQQVQVLRDNEIEWRDRQEFTFSHRKSSLGGETILAVRFELETAESAPLTKRMQKLWINRQSTKPADVTRIVMPFIDPDGISVGDLLRSVGLAGIREGDASLDGKHPEYLLAGDAATSDDCLRLIDRVREQVTLQSGIDLQLNLRIW